MSGFNKVFLIGNLVADPELKQTANGIPVTSFRIAVNRKYTKEAQQTDFIDIVAWRSIAEFVTRYFSKGKPILVCGSLQTRTWVDKENNKRYSTEVVADEVSFVGKKGDNDSYGGPSDSPSYSTPRVDAAFEELTTDDDLPF